MRPTVLPLLALALMAHCAAADVLISNTDQDHGGIPSVLSGQWVAAPFLTGTSPTKLNSISLVEYTVGEPTGSFSVSIYGDNNGLPGSLLPNGGLTGPSMPQGASFLLLDYTAPQPLMLSPNTKYWVVASSDNSSNEDTYAWPSADTTSYTTSVGWQFFDKYARSANFGATWQSSGVGIADGYGPQLLAINGTVVPEPSTAVLLVIGRVVAFAVRRR